MTEHCRRLRTAPLGCLLLLLSSGCHNSGSAPGLHESRERQAKAISAVEASGGTVASKQYPPGTGHVVTLKGATIDDELIEQLRLISNLSELDFSGSTITDAQLAQLALPYEGGGSPIATVFRLNLSDTAITDDGIRELSTLEWLADVNIAGSQVSDAGAKELEILRGKKPLPYGLKFKLTR